MPLERGVETSMNRRVFRILGAVLLGICSAYVFAYARFLRPVELKTYSSYFTFVFYILAIPIGSYSLGLLIGASHSIVPSGSSRALLVLRSCCLSFYILAAFVACLQSAELSELLLFISRYLAPVVFLLAGLFEVQGQTTPLLVSLFPAGDLVDENGINVLGTRNQAIECRKEGPPFFAGRPSGSATYGQGWRGRRRRTRCRAYTRRPRCARWRRAAVRAPRRSR